MFRIRKRSRLPHWDVDRGTYFITTSLADAVPREVRTRIDEERIAYVAEVERRRGRMTKAEEFALRQLIRDRLEQTLDAGIGECWLDRPPVADIVSNAITFFDCERYELLAWCVMPNHVHLLLRMLEGRIAGVMRSLKTFTAREANLVLSRAGTFWEAEYYDWSVRDVGELLRTVEYIRANPLKVGLVDWPWIRIYDDRLPVAGPEVRRLRTGGPRAGGESR